MKSRINNRDLSSTSHPDGASPLLPCASIPLRFSFDFRRCLDMRRRISGLRSRTALLPYPIRILGYVSFLPLLLSFFLFGAWVTGHLDTGYIRYTIKGHIEGKDMSDCMSWPEEYWRRFPGCAAPDLEERPRDDKPSRIWSLDEEQG